MKATAPGTRPTWETRNLRDYGSQAKALWGVVEQWSGHPLLIDVAAELIRKAGVEARDEEQLARTIQIFAQKFVKYFREYPERWASPLRTIAWGIGDCDDKSILIASMLRGFRIPVRLKFLRLTLPTGRRVSHVYPEAFLRNTWTPMESVRAVPLGYDPARLAQERGIPFTTETIGDTA